MDDPTDPEIVTNENTEKGSPSVEKPLVENAKGRTLWLHDGSWEKLNVLKDEFGGTWGRLVEVLCEQLLASGLVGVEARERIREISRQSGSEMADDSGWRTSFGIGEPWPEVAASQKKIAEELGMITVAIRELVVTVEDHATAILESDLSRSEEDSK